MSEYKIDWEWGDYPVARHCTLPNGVSAEIRYEEYTEHCDPRDYDNVGIMFCGHPDYELGDEQLPRGGFSDIDCPVCEGGELEFSGPDKINALGYSEGPTCPRCEGYYMVEPTVDEWLREQDAIAAQPLFLYDHGGITISSGQTIMVEQGVTRADIMSSGRFMGDEAGWDTSFIGFIIATEESIERLQGDDPKFRTEERLTEVFNVEVAEYAKYLEGDCYFYVVEDAEGNDLDSCGGFLGIEYVEGEAAESLEFYGEKYDTDKANEERERDECAARDIVTA